MEGTIDGIMEVNMGPMGISKYIQCYHLSLFLSIYLGEIGRYELICMASS